MISLTLADKLILNACKASDELIAKHGSEEHQDYISKSPEHKKWSECFQELRQYAEMIEKYASKMTISGNDILNSIRRSEKASGRIK